MLRITELEKKSKNILEEIKKESSKLSKTYQKTPENKQKIQNLLTKIQFNINEFEYIQGEKIKTLPQKIPNLISITNLSKSKSFLSWLFNNKEL